MSEGPSRREYLGGVAAITLLAGCNTAATATTTTATPAPDPTGSATEGWVLRLGSDAPAEWVDPTTVVFEVSESGEWHTATNHEVAIGERFHPELTEGVQYRIWVRSANGRRRGLGLYRYHGRPDVELILFPCCSDDFGREDHG